MTEAFQPIDIEGDTDVIRKVYELAVKKGFVVTEPMATESVSDALDAPISAEEIRAVCEIITLVSTTGTSVAGFLLAVKELLGRVEPESGEKPEVLLNDHKSQKELGKLDAETDIEDLNL